MTTGSVSRPAVHTGSLTLLICSQRVETHTQWVTFLFKLLKVKGIHPQNLLVYVESLLSFFGTRIPSHLPHFKSMLRTISLNRKFYISFTTARAGGSIRKRTFPLSRFQSKFTDTELSVIFPKNQDKIKHTNDSRETTGGCSLDLLETDWMSFLPRLDSPGQLSPRTVQKSEACCDPPHTQ